MSAASIGPKSPLQSSVEPSSKANAAPSSPQTIAIAEQMRTMEGARSKANQTIAVHEGQVQRLESRNQDLQVQKSVLRASRLPSEITMYNPSPEVFSILLEGQKIQITGPTLEGKAPQPFSSWEEVYAMVDREIGILEKMMTNSDPLFVRNRPHLQDKIDSLQMARDRLLARSKLVTIGEQQDDLQREIDRNNAVIGALQEEVFAGKQSVVHLNEQINECQSKINALQKGIFGVKP